jgi:hypothetical protein
LPSVVGSILIGAMKRQGFRDSESRRELVELAQDGSAAHRLARCTNALILLDKGMSYAAVAKALLLDDGYDPHMASAI